MAWQEYDHARKSWYYYDQNSNTYVYSNGLRIPRPPSTLGYAEGEAAQPTSTNPSGASHGRVPSGTSSDLSFASDFSTLSISSHSATGGSSGSSAPTYQTNVPSGRTGSTRGYVTSNYGYTPTPAATYPYSGYAPQVSLSSYQSSNLTRPTTYGRAPSYAGLAHNQLTNQTTVTRPSDEELLNNVGREVVLDPTVESTPPDLRSLGVRPHRIFRGSTRTHGTQERLNPSFYVRTPGCSYFKRGVVFRVLWPELRGDMGRDITIATTSFGEDIFYKIRWFVVVREGHNCCTCLSIQTYSGRGVPANKPKNHHAIMYTGQHEPQPEPDEIVTDEPPMGPSIRVLGSKRFNKMDPKSRVNFLKIYTVEHNVKVEDFGSVDPNDEWKLITQFNSHWGIPGDEALQPATRSKYYDRATYGPAPSTHVPSYAGSSVTAPLAATYNTNSTMYTSYNNPPIDEHTISGHQYQDPTTNTYTNSSNATYPYTASNNASYYSTAVAEDTYDTDPRPVHHRRSSSHRSERNYSTRRHY